MLHTTVVLRVNNQNLECEKNVHVNVYVNVTYDCSSQRKYWKSWVRWMNVYVNVTYDYSSQSKYWKSWVRWMFM
jgi:hypothetical protein